MAGLMTGRANSAKGVEKDSCNIPDGSLNALSNISLSIAPYVGSSMFNFSHACQTSTFCTTSPMLFRVDLNPRKPLRDGAKTAAKISAQAVMQLGEFRHFREPAGMCRSSCSSPMMFSRINKYEDVLSALKLPVLVTDGVEDRLILIGSGQFTTSIVTKAKGSFYDGIRHAPFLEAPMRFNREPAAFVQTAASP